MAALSSYPRKHLISVVGDARLKADDPKGPLAERLGTLLVESGFRVLTGGLFGVAEATSRGARMASKFSEGDVVGLLPGGECEAANEFIGVAIPTGLGLTRNALVASGDAVIAIGGGAGTLSEIAYAWMYRRMVIGFRVDGWSGRVADTKIDDRQRFREIPEDKVFGANTPEEAVGFLEEFIDRYCEGRHRSSKAT